MHQIRKMDNKNSKYRERPTCQAPVPLKGAVGAFQTRNSISPLTSRRLPQVWRAANFKSGFYGKYMIRADTIMKTSSQNTY